jgi:hypothetical protein
MAPIHRAFRGDASIKIMDKGFGIADGPMRMGQLVKCVQADVFGSLQDLLSPDLELYEPLQRSVGYLMAGPTVELEPKWYDVRYFRPSEGVYLLAKSKRRPSAAHDAQTFGFAEPRVPGGYVPAAQGQADSVSEPGAVGLTTAAIDNICELLRDLWLSQTANDSSMARIYSHPAFRQIVGLGEAALPFMYRHLVDEPELWTVGLTMVTGADPAADAQSPEEAIRAWRAWREAHAGR